MNLEIPIKSRFEGYFILIAHQCDKDGEVIPGTARHLAEFKNLITDVGLDMIGQGIPGGQVLVGTGATTPAFSDTSLVARIASTSNITGQVSSYIAGPPDYGQIVITWRFPAGAAAGNLAEIGVAGGTAAPLWSRALILDGVGTPTTITVLSTEALDCVYVLRMYPPQTDSSGSANMTITGNATTYNWTCRAAQVGSWNNFLSAFSAFGKTTGPFCTAYDGAIGSRATQPSGATQGSSGFTAGVYSNGSHSLLYTAAFGLINGNFANGITAFQVQGVGGFQIGINGGANIPKTANQTISGLTFNFSWTR